MILSRAACLWVVLCWLASATGSDLFPQLKPPAEVKVALGKHEVILGPGSGGLNYFPDEAVCIVKDQPLRFTIVAGDTTHLLEGRSFATAKPIAKLIGPGQKEDVDNHYAGIGGLHHDKPNKRWIGVYHAEDKEGIGFIEKTGAQGFYGTVCGVRISEDGQSIEKLGPVIAANKPKMIRGWETEGGPPEAWLAQGVGEPTMCLSGDGKYVMCWYTEWSTRLKRGVQICAARSPVGEAGLPGTWSKFHNGTFGEAGLGGNDTTVVASKPMSDSFTPHVQWVEPWKRYVMVFGCVVFADIDSGKSKESGLYVTTSKDGFTWHAPTLVEGVFPLVLVGQRCKIHPTLVVKSVNEKRLVGTLLYGFTPRWPDTPHHLAGCPVTLSWIGEPQDN